MLSLALLKRTTFLSGLLLIGLLAPAFAASPGQAEFDQGLQASQRGDHRSALTAFLSARRAGLDTPALRYNIGVSQFRLGNFAAAQQEFQALAKDPQWTSLAHYNLGLIARRLNQPDKAAQHFEQAYQTSDNPRLRALAATALDRLPVTARRARTSASASLAAGFDSNVALAPDAETLNLSDNSDLFIEAGAVLSHRIHADTDQARYIFGGLHLRSYHDMDAYDQYSLRLGVSQEQRIQRWQVEFSGLIDDIYVNSNRFQQSLAFNSRARRLLSKGRDVRLHYQASLIQGGNDYAYLDGWQQLFGIDTLQPLPTGHLRLGYQIELNDRDDLITGGDFYSYSPTRHSVFVIHDRPGAAGWFYRLRGEYAFTTYADPYLISGAQIQREDHRYLVGLRGHKRLGNKTRYFIDYRYVNNDSTLGAYDYHRHVIMTGVELRN